MTNTGNVLAELKRNIGELRSMVTQSDLVDTSERDQLKINVTYLKSFYERAEHLIRDRVNTDKPN